MMTYEEAVKCIGKTQYTSRENKHYANVIAIARHSETDEVMVVYTMDCKMYIKPAEKWKNEFFKNHFFHPDKIKPCPFCGNTDIEIFSSTPLKNDPDFEVYYACCSYCGTFGEEFETFEDAIEAWNTRYVPDKQKFFQKITSIIKKLFTR